jgi:tetratricopeptide (TPR) repeat protein
MPWTALGYQLIGLKRIPEAIKILRLNAEAYPEKAFCYESLGEAYLLNGDRENAILSYEKALKINPARPLAIEALNKLRGK